MIDSHKHITVDDVITTLRQALEEMPSAEEQVADKLLNRANELLGEISRERKLDKEEKDKEEAKKPYCSNEFLIVVEDPSGEILPAGPIEGFILRKCLTTKRVNGAHGADYPVADWDIEELPKRLDHFIDQTVNKKGHHYMYLEEFMEHGKNSLLKEWGLDRKSKFSAHVIPVKLESLKRIREQIENTEK